MANLPAVIIRSGGAIEKIVGTELAAYTDERFPLVRKDQFALGRLVEARPELNTEARVAVLVDMMAYHGHHVDAQLRKLLDHHDPEVIGFALDYLYEVGKKDRGMDGMEGVKSSLLHDTAEAVEVLIAERELEIGNVEMLADLIQSFGMDNILAGIFEEAEPQWQL